MIGTERLYGEITGSTATLAHLADGADLARQVPTCPDWRVHDVLAHLSGGMVDAINGNLEGGVATGDDFAKIQERVRAEVDAATDEAERSPMPRGEEAALGLYAGDGYWD